MNTQHAFFPFSAAGTVQLVHIAMCCAIDFQINFCVCLPGFRHATAVRSCLSPQFLVLVQTERSVVNSK